MIPALFRCLAVLATLLVLGAGAWSAGFAFYQVPGGPDAAAAAAGAFGIATLLSLWGLWARRPVWLLPLGIGFGAALVAFFLLAPSNDRDWAPDVSRPVTAEFGPDTVTLHDVRDFTWRSETDFTPAWQDRTYPLADLATLDVVNSYWTGPLIAHTLLSFGFADGRHVVFSVEIRREATEDYSAFAGFFRRYERITVAADERDIVRVRSNVRGEDAELFRVKADPAQVRALFREIVERADAVAQTPKWYNTLTANCTTEMFGAARAVAPALPFDWRIVVSGFLPDYLYDIGLLDRRLPFAAVKAASHIRERALAADGSPDFSRLIRVGVPDPNGIPNPDG